MSITLTNGKLVAFNGVTQENDNAGAVTLMSVDFLANIATFVLATGAVSGNSFVRGNYGDENVLTVNLTNGNWRDGAGHTGNLAGAALTNFNTQMKAIRNLVESFASGNAIMPGTPVAW